MRIYVPATLVRLRRYVEAGSIPGTTGHRVAEDESEDAEYDAMQAAALDAAGLLTGPGRRVVIVAEAGPGDGGVADVPMSDVVAVHADTGDVDPADPDPPELAWFATQEIPDLLA